jgi:hypothetical protein
MRVPFVVWPVAPSGVQYAPGWTTRADGVVRVGAGARVCVVVGRWVAVWVARGAGGDVTRVGALVVATAVVGAVVDVTLSLVAGVEGAAQPPRRASAASTTAGRIRRV